MINSPLLKISLTAVVDNFLLIKKRLNPACEMAGVVKANAYGLGVDKVAPVLYAQGCRRFFVATPEEGIALRALLADISIFVFGGFRRGAEDSYLSHNLVPVLNSRDDITRFKKTGGGACALFFDTGMNRLGLEEGDVEYFSRHPDFIGDLNVEMIISHFACADEEHPKNEEQYRAFEKIAALFPHIPKSLSNSSGIFRDDRFHFDIVRPGMALYGLNPLPEKPNHMHPVVSLETPVLQVRSVKKGETIGYGASYTFKKDSTIAVVALGYADGISRAFSNNGALYFNNMRLPVRGRVSMDFLTVEIDDLPEAQRPQPGDMLEVMGPNQSADDLARDAGTIGYEILTSLGQRYQRIYT